MTTNSTILSVFRKLSLLLPIYPAYVMISAANGNLPLPTMWWVWALAFLMLSIGMSAIILSERVPMTTTALIATVTYPALIFVCTRGMESALREGFPRAAEGIALQGPPVSLAVTFLVSAGIGAVLAFVAWRISKK